MVLGAHPGGPATRQSRPARRAIATSINKSGTGQPHRVVSCRGPGPRSVVTGGGNVLARRVVVRADGRIGDDEQLLLRMNNDSDVVNALKLALANAPAYRAVPGFEQSGAGRLYRASPWPTRSKPRSWRVARDGRGTG